MLGNLPVKRLFPLMLAILIGPTLLGQHDCIADEPPIHPRNRTWNGYTATDQYRPGWGNFDEVCSSCPVPTARPCLPGWKGQPYADKVLGCNRCGASACDCQDSCGPMNRFWGGGGPNSGCDYRINIQWPRPFSGMWDSKFSGQCCQQSGHSSGMASRFSCGHLLDKLDIFADVKLVESPRRDSGYCGPQCDPYGKLGLSRQPIASQNPANGHPSPTVPSPTVPSPAGPSPAAPMPNPPGPSNVAPGPLRQVQYSQAISGNNYWQATGTAPVQAGVPTGPVRPLAWPSHSMDRPTHSLPSVPRPFGMSGSGM